MFILILFATYWFLVAEFSVDRVLKPLVILRIARQHCTRNTHHFLPLFNFYCLSLYFLDIHSISIVLYDSTKEVAQRLGPQIMCNLEAIFKSFLILYIQGRMIGGSKIIAFVANVSKKTYKYVFESASVQKIHPMRNLTNGTDRLLLTPNLIALADHGTDKQSQSNVYTQQTFSNKLLKIIKNYFYQDPLGYCENIFKLVSESYSRNRQSGSCTLTVATMHPNTGDLSFYYIGDSLYAIFREKNVEIVEGLYHAFNQPIKIGYQCEYTPDCGYNESYQKADVNKHDIIVLGSNGLWDNVDINTIHYHVRGPGSLRAVDSKYKDAVGRQSREQLSLRETTEKIGTLAGICARRGKYESPIYLRAKRQNIQFPKQGFLDDVSVILARRKKQIVIEHSQESERVREHQQK